MKKCTAFSAITFLLLLVSSCNFASINIPSSSESPNLSSLASEPNTSIVTSSEVSSMATSTENSSDSQMPSSSSEVKESLVDTVLSYQSASTDYGNTNGNANNHGQVVYDRINHLHYFSVNNTLYSYHPVTKVTAIVFTAPGEGSLSDLCLTSTHMYYISSLNGHVNRYNFSTKTIEGISTNASYLLMRYSNNIYIDMAKMDAYQNPTRGLGIYKHSTQAFLSYFSSGITNVNLHGLRLIYNTNNGSTVQLMADTFNGKTDVKRYATLGITEIETMHIISESTDPSYHYWVVLKAKVGTETKLYVTNTGLETLTEIGSGSDISGINSDGSHVFFIQNGGLYTYTLADQTNRKIADVDVNTTRVYVVNHWLYFGNDTHASLSRIHPDNSAIETNFWIN